MKYHINGAKLGKEIVTLIHVDQADDQLGFLADLIKGAFSMAPPVGGPIMWHKHSGQKEMSDPEARDLIQKVSRDGHPFYEIHATTHRQRKTGIEIFGMPCDCEFDEPVFVLNEILFGATHGLSSEGLLQKLGARPWANRIRAAAIRDEQRGKEHLN